MPTFTDLIEQGLGTMPLGVADPTAGGGVAASIGTIGRSNTTPATFWKKTGAADTAWSEDVTPEDIASAIAALVGGASAAGDTLGEIEARLAAHASSTANPHAVTAAQVGLGNVDNTADADKPVSTAQRAAVNAKAPAGGLAFSATLGGRLTIAEIDTRNNPWAIAMEVKADAFGSSTANLIGRAGTNLSHIRLNSANQIYFNAEDNTNFGITLSEPLVAGAWCHMIVAYDGVSTYSAYIDGVLRGTVTVSGKTFRFNRLGGRLSGNFSGALRNFTPFNIAPTESQAAEIAAQGIGPWLAANPEYQWGDGSPKTLSTETWAKWFGTGTISSATSTGATIDSGASGLTLFKGDSGTADTWLVAEEGQKVAVTLTISGMDSGIIRLKRYNSDFGTASLPVSLANGTNTYILTATHQTGWFDLEFTSSSGGSFIVDSVYLLGAVACLPMNEGNGYQAHDLSGRYDATLSEEGVSHIIPRDRGRIRVKSVDGSTTGFLIGDRVLLDPNTVVTAVIVDGSYYEVPDSVDQNLNYRQIRIQDAAGYLNVQRSDGTNYQDLTPDPYLEPDSQSDFDLTLITQRTF